MRRSNRLGWILAATLAAVPHTAHTGIPIATDWDLASLYPDSLAWERDRAALDREAAKLAEAPKPIANARLLADALDRIADFNARSGKLSLYGTLLSQIDERSPAARHFHEEGTATQTRVAATVALLEEAVAARGSAQIERDLRAEPRLQRHRSRIRRIQREAGHQPSGDARALIASAGRWPQTSNDAHDALLRSDALRVPARTAAGDSIQIDVATWRRLRRSASADDRRLASLYLEQLRSFEELAGVLLTRRIEADRVLAKHRRYDDGIAAHLDREGLPAGARAIMIDATRAGLPEFHRYLKLRTRAVGPGNARYDDVYATLPAASRRIPIEESAALIVDAMAPMGAAYQQRLRDRLAQPWAHLEPGPEKGDPYGMYPPVGGARPYGVMSYREDLNSSRSLAGLATLMMTFADVPAGVGLDRWQDDPGIYSNAVLDVGRFLHDDLVIERATDSAARRVALIQALDRLSSYFRHAMACEFESLIQDSIARGSTPSGSALSRAWLELMRRSYGEREGVMQVGDTHACEWITLGISFSSYDTQNFPFDLAAAALMVEKLRAGDARVRTLMEQLFARGEDNRSHALLLQAGVDLGGTEPYRALLRRMDALCDRLEEVLAAGS